MQTAEMPGFYQDGEYDVAGFAVGAVKRDAVIDGTSIREGDAVLALASSGVHSNGFSLVRKVLEVCTATVGRGICQTAVISCRCGQEEECQPFSLCILVLSSAD